MDSDVELLMNLSYGGISLDDTHIISNCVESRKSSKMSFGLSMKKKGAHSFNLHGVAKRPRNILRTGDEEEGSCFKHSSEISLKRERRGCDLVTPMVLDCVGRFRG